MLRHDFLGKAELRQGFTGHHFRGQLGQRDSDRLAHEGNGPRRARVHFEDIDIFAFHRELYIH